MHKPDDCFAANQLTRPATIVRYYKIKVWIMLNRCLGNEQPGPRIHDKPFEHQGDEAARRKNRDMKK